MILTVAAGGPAGQLKVMFHSSCHSRFSDTSLPCKRDVCAIGGRKPQTPRLQKKSLPDVCRSREEKARKK